MEFLLSLTSKRSGGGSDYVSDGCVFRSRRGHCVQFLFHMNGCWTDIVPAVFVFVFVADTSVVMQARQF